MHDGVNVLNWREIVDTHHAALVDELAKRLDSDLKDAAEQAVASERSHAALQVVLACEEARRSQAELLNQSLRRLRQATGEEQILQALAESCAHYAEMSVVLVFENNQARAAASYGVDSGELSFDIASAPALLAAIESRDPMVALANGAEISSALARKFHADTVPGDRHAYLFPLTSRQTVVAMLIASGNTASGNAVLGNTASGNTAPISAPIELLCEAAGMRLESLLPPAPAYKKADEALPAAERLSWDALSPEDQKLHLRAQRIARVRVAEMRLDHEKELRSGVASSDIYTALQPAIDSARNEFLQNFLAKSSTMVDYLHLEMLRGLAHDDDRLLGRNYPGPMV